MTYRNEVIYTTWNENLRINVEHRAILDRKRQLTTKGAQRILRKQGFHETLPCVVQVSSFQYA